MAWTDLLQGTRQSLGGSLDRRAQKKDSAWSRLQSTLSQLSAQGQQTSERVAGEEFAAGENELERVARSREGGLDRAMQYRTTKLAGKQRMDVAEFSAKQNAKLQEIVFSHQQAIEGISDENAREREIDRFENELKLLGQQYANAYEDFPEGVTVDIDDPTNGDTYRANNPAEVEAFLTKVAENASTAKAKALQDSGLDENSVAAGVWDAEFANLRSSRPDLWPPGQGDFITVDQDTHDELLNAFNNKLNTLSDYLDPDDRLKLLELFETYVRLDMPDPVDGGGTISLDAASLATLEAAIAALAGGTGGYDNPPPENPTERVVPVRPGEDRAEVGGGLHNEEAEAASLEIIGMLDPLLGRSDKREVDAFRTAIERSGPNDLIDPGTWELLVDLLEELAEKFALTTGAVE